ncbi:MAG: WD40 repeat domain-containing protein, partial [Acidimicrobiia bacterium]
GYATPDTLEHYREKGEPLTSTKHITLEELKEAENSDGVTLLDPSTGATVWEAPLPAPSVVEVAPSGAMVAVVAGEDTVHLIDSKRGAALAAPLLFDTQVVSLAFDGRGGRLAVGGFDGTVHLIEGATGTRLAKWSAHPELDATGIDFPPHQPNLAQIGTRAIAFDDAGSRIITGGLVWARVWDVESTRLLSEVTVDREAAPDARAPAAARSVRFLPGRDDAFAVASGFNVLTYEMAGGSAAVTSERTFPERINTVFVPGVDADVVLGDELAVFGGSGGRILVVPFDPLIPTNEFNAQLGGQPALALDESGGAIAFAGDGGISLWSLSGAGLINKAVPRDGQNEATISTDGATLLLGSPTEAQVALWSLDGAAPRRIPVPAEPSSQFGYMGWSDSLMTWNFDDRIQRHRRLGDLDDPGTVITVGSLFSSTDSPDGRLLATGGTTAEGVHVFDVENGRPAASLTPFEDAGDEEFIVSLSFSGDASRLAVASDSGELAIYDTSSWDLLRREGGAGQMVLAEYDPAGRWLVTVSRDGQILLRDPTTLQPDGGPLLGNTDAVTGFSHGPFFSADGRFLVTASDGQGRIWDLESRTQVGSTFPNAPGAVSSASMTGEWLATFESDSVLIWDLDVDRWYEIACRAAGRNLERDEWTQFGPTGEPYATTCDMWPAPDE